MSKINITSELIKETIESSMEDGTIPSIVWQVIKSNNNRQWSKRIVNAIKIALTEKNLPDRYRVTWHVSTIRIHQVDKHGCELDKYYSFVTDAVKGQKCVIDANQFHERNKCFYEASAERNSDRVTAHNKEEKIEELAEAMNAFIEAKSKLQVLLRSEFKICEDEIVELLPFGEL